MGYGTIIAGIYCVAILLVSFYVFADSVNRLSATSWKSLESAANMNMERLRSAVSITSVAVAGNWTRLYVNLTNIGEVKIDRSEFPEIDLLLTYTDNATGTVQTYWCYYDSIDSGTYRWTLNNTISPNPSPSIVNPLDWDPSETLAITIYLPLSNHFMINASGYLKVILPQGSSDGKVFFTG
jgi:archaellum component FlaF (FlaF/FlaG flagellin family)